MTKSELIRTVSKRSGKTQREVTLVMDTMTKVIIEAVAQGEQVQIHNFGRWDRRYREGRVVFGTRCPGHYVTKFTAGDAFKQRMNGDGSAIG